MITHTYKCERKELNPLMGGEVCWQGNTGFYFDKSNTVKVGDIVKFEFSPHRSTWIKMWVNDVLIHTR